MGYGDDFVTRTNAGCQKRQVQSARSVVYTDSFSIVAVVGIFLLKSEHIGAQRKSAAFEDSLNGRVDFRLDRVILGFEVNKRDHIYFPWRGR